MTGFWHSMRAAADFPVAVGSWVCATEPWRSTLLAGACGLREVRFLVGGKPQVLARRISPSPGTYIPGVAISDAFRSKLALLGAPPPGGDRRRYTTASRRAIVKASMLEKKKYREPQFYYRRLTRHLDNPMRARFEPSSSAGETCWCDIHVINSCQARASSSLKANAKTDQNSTGFDVWAK
jgi:hypothetical protein